MRQYLTSPASSRKSFFKYDMRKVESVGGLLGRFEDTTINAYRLALLLDIESNTDISKAGLLAGSVTGKMDIH